MAADGTDAYEEMLRQYAPEAQGHGDYPSFLPLPPLPSRQVFENYNRPEPITAQPERDTAAFLATPYAVGHSVGEPLAGGVNELLQRHYGNAASYVPSLAGELLLAAAPIPGMKGRPVVPRRLENGFYSQLDTVLGGFSPKDTVTLKTLADRGVKRAELEARGLMPLLEGQGAKVGDLAKVAGENPIKLQDTRYAHTDMERYDDLALERFGSTYDDITVPQQIAVEQELGGQPLKSPRWEEYSGAPGSPTYEERVISMPMLPDENKAKAAFEADYPSGAKRWEDLSQADRRYLTAKHATKLFQSGHFDEPNIIGHYQRSLETRAVPPEQLADIGNRMAKAVNEGPLGGNYRPEDLGSGAYDRAIKSGTVTPEEAAIYAHSKGWNIDAPDPRKTFVPWQVQSDWGQAIRDQQREAYAQKMFQTRFVDATPEQRAAISKQIQTDGPGALAGGRDEAKVAELEKAYRATIDKHNPELEKWQEFIKTLGDKARPAQGRWLPDGRSHGFSDLGRGIENWYNDNSFLLTDAQKAEFKRHAMQIEYARRDIQRVGAELETAKGAAPGHPMVNSTDQWGKLIARKIIQDAVEQGATGIATPTGGTVLSYNPGKEAGMEGFYGDVAGRNGIWPTILEKELQRLYGQGYPGRTTTELRYPDPSQRHIAQEHSPRVSAAFHYFPLPPKIKEEVAKGLPLFSLGAAGVTARTIADILSQYRTTDD